MMNKPLCICLFKIILFALFHMQYAFGDSKYLEYPKLSEAKQGRYYNDSAINLYSAIDLQIKVSSFLNNSKSVLIGEFIDIPTYHGDDSQLLKDNYATVKFKIDEIVYGKVVGKIVGLENVANKTLVYPYLNISRWEYREELRQVVKANYKLYSKKLLKKKEELKKGLIDKDDYFSWVKRELLDSWWHPYINSSIIPVGPIHLETGHHNKNHYYEIHPKRKYLIVIDGIVNEVESKASADDFVPKYKLNRYSVFEGKLAEKIVDLIKK